MYRYVENRSNTPRCWNWCWAITKQFSQHGRGQGLQCLTFGKSFNQSLERVKLGPRDWASDILGKWKNMFITEMSFWFSHHHHNNNNHHHFFVVVAVTCFCLLFRYSYHSDHHFCEEVAQHFAQPRLRQVLQPELGPVAVALVLGHGSYGKHGSHGSHGWQLVQWLTSRFDSYCLIRPCIYIYIVVLVYTRFGSNMAMVWGCNLGEVLQRVQGFTQRRCISRITHSWYLCVCFFCLLCTSFGCREKWCKLIWSYMEIFAHSAIASDWVPFLFN